MDFNDKHQDGEPCPGCGEVHPPLSEQDIIEKLNGLLGDEDGNVDVKILDGNTMNHLLELILGQERGVFRCTIVSDNPDLDITIVNDIDNCPDAFSGTVKSFRVMMESSKEGTVPPEVIQELMRGPFTISVRKLD